jgi:Cu2+-exporting ATPase
VIRVKPGETVPADGVVEGAVEPTRRSSPARAAGAQAPGAEITGGTVNVSSPLCVRVSRTGEHTRLAAIRQLMERPPPRSPGRPAGRPGGGLLHHRAAGAGLRHRRLVVAIRTAPCGFVSVLVVSPCALSLATPVALTVATDALARMGVLVTRGHAIEALARAEHFVFDKTGTLTYGDAPRAGAPARRPAGQRAGLAAALEQGSEHAIARPCAWAAARLRACFAAVTATTGQGVAGELDGVAIASAAPPRPPRWHAGPGVLLQAERRRTVIALASSPAGSAASCSATGCGDCEATFDVLRGRARPVDLQRRHALHGRTGPPPGRRPRWAA